MTIKKIRKPILLFVNICFSIVNYAQTIPQTEAEFVNSSNFPTIPGDAMVPSRTNYYRADGYEYTKKADGSLYLSTGGWGGSQVDSQGNLVKYLNKFNHATNGSYYKLDYMKPWNIEENQFENGFFRLYSNLKLPQSNPTPDNTNSALKTLRTTTNSFPYFNSYPEENGNMVYNWQAWLYPIVGGARFVNPKKANELRTNTYGSSTITYRDYNYLTLRDTDNANDLTENSLDQNFEITLSNEAINPTQIHTRINTLRDKLVLSVWYGYQPLAGTASKPLSDLRIANWDDSYKMNYKLWFNSTVAVTPSASSNEYQKIRLANQKAALINNANNGSGTDIREFNAKFDEFSDLAEDMISGGTEAAMEMFGIREINYANDVDPYGKHQNYIELKFRMLTVGMTFDALKIQQRVYNTTFTFSERFLNPDGSGYNEFKQKFEQRGLNFFHPKHPFGLTQEHYIKILTTRPSISFNTVDASDTSIYFGKPLEIKQGEGTLEVVNLNISEHSDALLPFQEIETTKEAPQIDANRVRVSLVKKSDYLAALSTASTLSGYDATNNPMPNNDLPTLNNFSYISQDNFVANVANIPAGEYYIKYDYSSPDSSTNIKTTGDTLGNVFAKSIYRQLKVTPKSVSRVNPNLRVRSSL